MILDNSAQLFHDLIRAKEMPGKKRLQLMLKVSQQNDLGFNIGPDAVASKLNLSAAFAQPLNNTASTLALQPDQSLCGSQWSHTLCWDAKRTLLQFASMHVKASSVLANSSRSSCSCEVQSECEMNT
jgi:hypothetical protein